MLVPAGIPVNFDAVFVSATPANVAFSVYDCTESLPVLLLSPVAMDPVAGNAYTCKFTPEAGKLYVVFMAVYTSSAFSALDPSFASAQQAESVTAQYLSPPVQSVVGMISCEGGSVDSPNVFSIFRGNAKTAYFLVQNADNNFAPVDLTNCSEITVSLLASDGTVITLNLSDEDIIITQPSNLGAFSAAFSAEVSALLNVGEFQNIDVTFTILTEVFTVRYYRSLSVFEVA